MCPSRRFHGCGRWGSARAQGSQRMLRPRPRPSGEREHPPCRAVLVGPRVPLGPEARHPLVHRIRGVNRSIGCGPIADRVPDMDADPQLRCMLVAQDVCVALDATFPFWEVLATLLVTAFVTYVTIWVSVRAARRETDRVLAADAVVRAREAAARERADALEQQRESTASRVNLAREMTRLSAACHRLQLMGATSEEIILTKAEWSALRVSFETSGLPLAAELYEWADLLIKAAHSKPAKDAQSLAVMAFLARERVDADIARRAASWAADPETIRDGTRDELERLRAEREADAASLRARITKVVLRHPELLE